MARKTEFLSQLKVMAEDRKAYLKDITEAISGLSVNITSVDVKVEDAVALCMIIISVPNVRRLNMVIKKIENIPGTVSVQRST